MFHPLHGGAHGVVRNALICTGNFASNVSKLDETQVFFKTYNQFQQCSSKHWVDLIKLLHMTINLSNVSNNVLSWLSSHEKDIYKLFMGEKHSMQTNPYQCQCKYSMHITRCLYWPCSWSWHTNHIWSWFHNWAKFCRIAWIRAML